MNGMLIAAAHRKARAPTQALVLLTAVTMVLLGLLGHALMTAPTAAAYTAEEQMYISLLADEGIGPVGNGTYDDMVFIGHVIAYDLRRGVHPVDEAYTLWRNNPYLTKDAAITVVATALVVFAPELVPIYTDETAGPPDGMAV